MRFGINLRGDLAKLSDAELATRLDETCKELEATKPAPRFSPVLAGVRGPLRHPWFYKLHMLLAADMWPGNAGVAQRHLLECELQDLNDELLRRVQMHKSAKVTS